MKLAILIFLSLILQTCATNATKKGDLSNSNSTTKVNEINNANTSRDNSDRGNRLDHYNIKDSLGLVAANGKRYEQGRSIRIYNQDRSIWYEFSSKNKNEEGVIVLDNQELSPFRLVADELLLVMNCVGEDSRYYHVIVNEDTQLKKYVRKDDPVLQLETWEKYILDCFAVGFDSKSNPLRDAPDGVDLDLEAGKEMTFHPEKIEGDWLNVRWAEKNGDKTTEKFGWIRWKDNGKLILQLFETA